MSTYDVIIVGAGPAGLSAALVLGRARRRVLICDRGTPRNFASRSLHGFLTRDGIAPQELLAIGRAQLQAYKDVEYRAAEVTDVRRQESLFEATLADGGRCTGRKLLLATGTVDELPPIPGIEEYYGRSVFHCPYCDGWEVRDRPLAAYGRKDKGVGLARNLLGWSRDVVVCSDGEPSFSKDDRAFLKQHDIAVRSAPIVALEGKDGLLERLRFADGSVLERRALFFNTGQKPQSALAERLGCKMSEKGSIVTDKHEGTCVPGVYVAGDASRDLQLAIMAAAEGANAAFAINKALLEEDVQPASAKQG